MKLKPCPFCGAAVELEQTIDGREWWGVICRNSKSYGGSCAIQQRPSGSKDAAINRWNTRAESEEIKELRAILQNIHDELEYDATNWFLIKDVIKAALKGESK